MIKHLGKILLPALLLLGLYNRLADLGELGKDSQTYVTAITTFFEGGNPYEHTVRSYENKDDIGGHGYAYFPGFLYLFGFLYMLALKFGTDYDTLWKGSVLVFDLAVAVLLFMELKKLDLKAAYFGVIVWLFNPYLTVRYTNYNLVDPIPIFFIILALQKLKKDDVLAGVFFTLSVIFKPFGLIFLPLFLLESKNWRVFVLACGIVFTTISLPFLISLSNLITYLQGSLFVHSSRVLQGRPILFYLSYYLKIELFQIIPLAFYNFMATYFGWFLVVATYVLGKVRNKYFLASLSATNFLLFTPVLNRTYLLWFLPLFIIAFLYLAKHYNKKLLYYIPVSVFWLTCYWYLNQWRDGFHVWHP